MLHGNIKMTELYGGILASIYTNLYGFYNVCVYLMQDTYFPTKQYIQSYQSLSYSIHGQTQDAKEATHIQIHVAHRLYTYIPGAL